MTRNTDRLEILARDLASRYGANDQMVCGLKSVNVPKTGPTGLGHGVWRNAKKYSFKPARLAKLGICGPE
jgi:hypothetical protein